MDLIGDYVRIGSKLVKDNLTLLVRERKKKSKKPKLFLAFYNERFKYLSSLFPTEEENFYLFDDRKNSYLLELRQTEARINLFLLDKV